MRNVYDARQEGKTAYLSYRQITIRNNSNTKILSQPGNQTNVQKAVQKLESGSVSPIVSPSIRSPRTPLPLHHPDEPPKLRVKPPIKYSK